MTKRPTVKHLQEQLQQQANNLELYQERIADLELALEDIGWQRLTWQTDQEFSVDGLRRIRYLARLFFLKNPLVKRAVTVQSHYVFGQGVSIASPEPVVNEVIQRFLSDAKNQAELTTHQARIMKEQELALLGDVFFVLFPSRTTGRVLIRTIPPDEVDDIICNPEDAKEPWFYRRRWQATRFDPSGNPIRSSQTAYYPDWRYTPSFKPRNIGQHPVRWESPVYHVKVGGLSDMKFGVSEVYAAIDWARAYKEFLEDWATLTRAYSRWAHKITTKGGSRGIAAAKSKLNTTFGNSGTGTETNPPPLVGSTFLQGEGTNLETMRIGGANVSAEDGRRIMLMVMSAVGLPETFFGDASVGTLATAKSLDRPTELKMVDRRTLWSDVFKNLVSFALYWAARAPGGRLAGQVMIEEEEDGTPRLTFQGEPIQIDVDYPPLLEHDVDEQVGAISQAAPNIPDARLIAKMLLTALGQDDIDSLLDEMFNEDGSPKSPPPAPALPPGGSSDEEEEPEEEEEEREGEEARPASEALMVEAVQELRGALMVIMEKYSGNGTG